MAMTSISWYGFDGEAQALVEDKHDDLEDEAGWAINKSEELHEATEMLSSMDLNVDKEN